ncbi:MAG: DUF3313 domain-containing protein [Syntrophorhabdaceae bacterium]
MKKLTGIALAVIIGIALMVPALFAAEPKYSGFFGDSTYSLLQPGPEGAAKMRYLKPGVDFGKYKRFMVDSVVFYLADDSQYKGIDPQEMKELADSFNMEIMKALRDRYPVVAEPGPDVARIRFAITGLKQSNPVKSGITSILPVGLGISLVKKGSTGAWSGSGATSTEVMILDSTTNEIMAAAVDERTAGFSERFSKWGSAQEAFTFWAQRLRTVLDNVRATSK